MNLDNNNVKVGRKRYTLDIIVWCLWAILMWGFLGLLAYTNSPRNEAGLHEVIVITYFFGFSIIMAILYIFALKKGV